MTATEVAPTDEPRLTDAAHTYTGGDGGPTPGAAAAPRGEKGQALILVVERDPHMRELEAYFLSEAGFATEFAGDGVAALEIARQRRPAIVVTEVLVPKMDGLALCRALKADPAMEGTAVLVLSILAASGRAREAGADAFLMKPLAERRLVDTVHALLERRGRPAPSPDAPPALPPPTPDSA